MSSHNTIKLSPTLRRLLLDCRTKCSADCCRDMAFDFSERRMTSWLEAERIDRTVEPAQEIEAIEMRAGKPGSPAAKVSLDARDLISEWPVAEFTAFWARLEHAFAKALENPT